MSQMGPKLRARGVEMEDNCSGAKSRLEGYHELQCRLVSV